MFQIGKCHKIPILFLTHFVVKYCIYLQNFCSERDARPNPRKRRSVLTSPSRTHYNAGALAKFLLNVACAAGCPGGQWQRAAAVSAAMEKSV